MSLSNLYTVEATTNQRISELRMVFHHVRQLVEQRYSDNRNMRWQSVSSFCFLRFIVPAILHPHLFGLCNGVPFIDCVVIPSSAEIVSGRFAFNGCPTISYIGCASHSKFGKLKYREYLFRLPRSRLD